MDSKYVPPPSIRTNVLSIQSHVVHGCVGNSAATFPMQINGVDVDTFNILSFSNHTGYPLFKGYRITPEQFRSIADGLVQNGFTKKYDFVLSGYIGNAPVMEELGTFVEKICQESRRGAANLVYVCDPVCGDLGKLYVSEECVDIYRKVLLPLATIALPNGFEASVISGVEVNSIESAVLASEWFHTVAKVPIVVIKSFSDVGRDPQRQKIFMLVSEAVADEETIGEKGVSGNGSPSTKSTESGGHRRRHIIEVEYITGYFTGTGDTFGGLFMAHYAKARHSHSSDETMKKKSVVECVAMAASATLGVLKRTREIRSFVSLQNSSSSAASSSSAEDEKKVVFSELRGEGESDDFQERELMIIHSADILVREVIHVTVRPL